MGIIPNWVYEFPGEYWKTFVDNAKKNLPEFKDEVIGGVKTVLQVPGKVIEIAVKPFYRPIIIIGIVAFLLLIIWNKMLKKGIA